MHVPFAVAFDLDMTLFDTGSFDTGPPLVDGPFVLEAREAVDTVRSFGGRTMVVTAKNAGQAQLHVDHAGLDIDVVLGDLGGAGKRVALVADGASIYIGDHVRDVAGAAAAGVIVVAVATGPCTASELDAAGADVVLTDLTQFAEWFRSHVMAHRLAVLDERLRALGSVLVAFSGGADSAFLLAAAVRALGPERVLAATAVSDSLPESELAPARSFARSLGVPHVTPRTSEMQREGYRANAGDRCYFCKAELVEVLAPIAVEYGMATVATGTNADDALRGFRPGIRAVDERGGVTPLLDAGLTKEQVRAASREWGLSTWDKPAAACLSSRIAFGIEVTPGRLVRVDRAEAAVRSMLDTRGVVTEQLRVRDLGDRARIELDVATVAALADDAALTAELVAAVRAAGFADGYVDPDGFRSGSMNELLPDPARYR